MEWEPSRLEHVVIGFLDLPAIVALAQRIGLTDALRRARRSGAWRRPRGTEWRSAERELARVHRQEVARLLRAAAELRLGRGDRDPRLVAEAGHEVVLPWRWRKDAAFAVLGTLADGVEPIVVADLFPWLLRAPSEWPSALELASASLLGEDCQEGRLLLSRVHQVEGNLRDAAVVLSRALRRGVSSDNRWRVFSNLAALHEDCGGDRLALEALRVATRDERCSVAPRVSALFLALAMGDRCGASRAAATLRGTAVDDRELRAWCAHRVEYLRRRGESRPWSPPRREARRLFDAWRRSDIGSVSHVCRVLAGETS
jgi:hypothetical protein